MTSRKYVLLLILVCLICPSAHAFKSGAGEGDQNVRNGEFFKRLEALKEKALSATGSVKSRGALKARPEIIIKGEVIYFNGTGLRMRESLAAWIKALSTKPRCSRQKITVCAWDDWGLQVVTDDKEKPNVTSMNLYFNFVDDEGENLGSVDTSIGTNGRQDSHWAVRRAFAGYFALDGFSIDSKSQFREIRGATGYKRALQCGLRDCMFAKGTFGKDAQIYMTLNGSDDRATLREFSISSDSYTR